MARSSSRMAQPLRLRPLTCGFNYRSLPESVSDGVFRLTQNMRQSDEGAARFPGWQKFLSGFITDRAYNNEDGRDQLLSLQTYYDRLDEDEDDSSVTSWPNGTYCGTTLKTRTHGRQPYTFLAEVTSTVGTRHLLRGTQSRLYECFVGKGNQRILRDGLGGISDNPEIRLRHSQVGDFVFLTNNYDRPFSYTIGTGAHGCAMNATDEIEELATMGITKVLVTFQYRGILFIANTEEDGQRKANMVRWCSSDPRHWIESPGFRLSGHFELDYGEEVLGGGVIGDFAYLHTTRGAWQISLSPDPSVIFNFQKLPGGGTENDSTTGRIAYPHTFVSTGSKHYYMSKDGIYEFDPAFPMPQRVEWIHQSSSILYDNLNKSRCAMHTAGYDPINEEMYFSCVQGSDTLPSVGLYCSTRYNQCSKLDFGATAFLSCTPSNSPTFRDWLIENCICSEAALNSAELQAIGFATVKEGSGKPKTDPACTEYPQYIHTSATITVSGLTIEDFNQEAGDDAVCKFFPEATIADLCLGCEGETFFTFAHADDYCIKQIGGAFSREMCTDTTNGTYSTVGYQTRMVKILTFGTGLPKVMERAAFEFDVADELVPLEIKLRSGRSIRIQDPLSTRNSCQIEWLDENPVTGPLKLECVEDDRVLQWPLFRRAEALYLDWTIDGKGGDVTFSSLEVDVAQDPKHI